MQCPNCGRDNPADARFCFSCGRPFEEAAAREERKFVTVLFADLVGFTSRAEQMDPEDVRALLAPYHQRLRSELEPRLRSATGCVMKRLTSSSASPSTPARR
jgi:hypothetical protein